MSGFPYSDDNKRYYTYAYFLKHRKGGRVVRVPLDGGFTCPNRDGKLGIGGCAFCSGRGSGDQIAALPSLEEQYRAGIEKVQGKWKNARYQPYFQAFSGTYAPVETLREQYDRALALPGAAGLVIGTRADCIDERTADLLAEYAQKTDLTVELGLQTVHDRTLQAMSRCETFDQFCKGYDRLKKRGICTWVHLINGLPGESLDDMRESAHVLGHMYPDGVKIHALHVLKGTKLAQMDFPLLTREEYVEVTCDQLERLPMTTVIGRLTGDGPAQDVLGPMWTKRKREVLNAIDQELARRDSWQGKKFN